MLGVFLSASEMTELCCSTFNEFSYIFCVIIQLAKARLLLGGTWPHLSRLSFQGKIALRVHLPLKSINRFSFLVRPVKSQSPLYERSLAPAANIRPLHGSRFNILKNLPFHSKFLQPGIMLCKFSIMHIFHKSVLFLFFVNLHSHVLSDKSEPPPWLCSSP